MTRQTMRIEEAAKLVGLSRAAMYRAANRGDIPVIRIGRRILVKRSAFEAMLGITSAAQTGNERSVADARDAK